jgi:hypothetical protein
MAKYRKKPVVIEAVQYTGKNSGEIAEFMNTPIRTKTSPEEGNPLGKIAIETLEGDMTVSEYDWVIKGVNGEYYPCKPEIFELTYEIVKETIPAIAGGVRTVTDHVDFAIKNQTHT